MLERLGAPPGIEVLMMTMSLRRIPVVLGLLVLGAVGLLVSPGARAGDPADAPQGPGTWVYDVRVVRVDSTESRVIEVAPPWQPVGSAGASTTAPWAELLAGLKSRGAATILLDQRLTAISGVPAVFKQQRMRMTQTLQQRSGSTEVWTSSSVESGAGGELVSKSDGLQYRVDVTWEEGPTTDGTAPLWTGRAEWKGSCANFKAGETLVLPHRQQQIAGAAGAKGLEIYVFVTGWPVSAK